MEFRLVLRGHLPSNKRGTVDAKHRIRRELHPQLRSLWQQHPALKDFWEHPRHGFARISDRAKQFERFGFRFLPLVTADAEIACALDILILRREEPFHLFTGGGDIDGRVKTLLDGLRMPSQGPEVNGQKPESDEDPFFCLLEDDKLIYEINVTTDRLLVPPEPQEPHRDVVAVIRVKTKSFGANFLSVYDIGP
jgi:hypothetical protein